MLDARDRMKVCADDDGRAACGDGGDMSTLRALLVDATVPAALARNAAVVTAPPIRGATGGGSAAGGTGGDCDELVAESLEADDGCDDRVDREKRESLRDEKREGARAPAPTLAKVDDDGGGASAAAGSPLPLPATDSSVSGGGGGGGTLSSSSSLASS